MQVIKNTLAFLERVDLKGTEVPAYTECIRYLNQELINGSKKELKDSISERTEEWKEKANSDK